MHRHNIGSAMALESGPQSRRSRRTDRRPENVPGALEKQGLGLLKAEKMKETIEESVEFVVSLSPQNFNFNPNISPTKKLLKTCLCVFVGFSRDMLYPKSSDFSLIFPSDPKDCQLSVIPQCASST